MSGRPAPAAWHRPYRSCFHEGAIGFPGLAERLALRGRLSGLGLLDNARGHLREGLVTAPRARILWEELSSSSALVVPKKNTGDNHNIPSKDEVVYRRAIPERDGGPEGRSSRLRLVIALPEPA